MTTRYYTYSPDTKRLSAAPKCVRYGGHLYGNPKAEHYALINAYPRGNSAAPTPPEGKVAVADGYALVNGEWVAQYRFEDAPPPPPRRFSKLRLYAALSKAGLWDALKSWLEAQTYEGMNAWEAFSLAQELTEDHPMFAEWFSAAKAALGVDDATAEELLARCVKEGY